MHFSLQCKNAVNQFSHAVDEIFANRHCQTNGNEGLGANIGMHFNIFHLVFTVCRYAHLTKETEIHTGADAQHTTYSERTPTAFQVFIYIQLEMSFYSSCNLSLWLLIQMCVCVPKCELSFLLLIWCFTAIWCVRAGISLCLCESVVMCLGYQVCESRQPPVLAGHHTESSFDGSATSSSFLCSIFSFDSQTQ